MPSRVALLQPSPQARWFLPGRRASIALPAFCGWCHARRRCWISWFGRRSASRILSKRYRTNDALHESRYHARNEAAETTAEPRAYDRYRIPHDRREGLSRFYDEGSGGELNVSAMAFMLIFPAKKCLAAVCSKFMVLDTDPIPGAMGRYAQAHDAPRFATVFRYRTSPRSAWMIRLLGSAWRSILKRS